MALLLRQRGITRVRPLEGGFEAWQKLGYPLDEGAPAIQRLPSVGPATPKPAAQPGQ